MIPRKRVRQTCITEMFLNQQQTQEATVQKSMRQKRSQLVAAENIAPASNMVMTSSENPDSCNFDASNLKEFFHEFNYYRYPVSYEVFKKYINHEYLMKRIIYKQVKGDPHKLRACYRNEEYYEKSLHSYYESFYRHPESRNKYKYEFKDASPEILLKLLSNMEVHRTTTAMVSIPISNFDFLNNESYFCSENKQIETNQSSSHLNAEARSAISELSEKKGEESLATEQAVPAEDINLSKDANVFATAMEEPPIIADTQEPIDEPKTKRNTSKSNAAEEVHSLDSQVEATTAVEPSQAAETVNVASNAADAIVESKKQISVNKKVLYPVSLALFKKYVDCDRSLKMMAHKQAAGNANKYTELLNDAEFLNRQLYKLYVTYYVNPSARKMLNFKFDRAPPILKERLLRVATVLDDGTETKADTHAQENIETETLADGNLEIAKVTTPVAEPLNLMMQGTIAVADPTTNASMTNTQEKLATLDAQVSESTAVAAVKPMQAEGETVKVVHLEADAKAESKKETTSRKKVLYPVSLSTFKKYVDCEKAIKMMAHKHAPGNANKYTQLLNDVGFREKQLHMLYVTFYNNPSARKMLNFKFDGAPPKLKERLLRVATVLEKSMSTPKRAYISAKVESPQLIDIIEKRFVDKQSSNKVRILSNYLLTAPATVSAPDRKALQEPDQANALPISTQAPLQSVATAQQVLESRLKPADVNLSNESQPKSPPVYKTRTQEWVSSITECSPRGRPNVQLCTSEDLLVQSNVKVISATITPTTPGPQSTSTKSQHSHTMSRLTHSSSASIVSQPVPTTVHRNMQESYAKSPKANTIKKEEPEHTTIESSSCGRCCNQGLLLPFKEKAKSVMIKTAESQSISATPKNSLAMSPSTHSASSPIVSPSRNDAAVTTASKDLQDLQAVASSSAVEYAQSHNLQYMMRVNHGVRQSVWRAIKHMSLQDFKTYMGIYNEQTIMENDLQLQQVYRDTIKADSNNWPMNLYMKMATIIDFLVAKKVKMNDFNLKYISPKLLHWSELMIYTTFDDCLSYDYYKRLRKWPHEEQLHRERLAYYKRCWIHDKWISQTPRVIFSEFNIDFDTKMSASQADNEISVPYASQVITVNSRLAAGIQMASQAAHVLGEVTFNTTAYEERNVMPNIQQSSTSKQTQSWEHSYSRASVPLQNHSFVDMERFLCTQSQVDSREVTECDPLTEEAALSTSALCVTNKPVTIKQEPLDKLVFTLNSSEDDNGYVCETMSDTVLNIDDDDDSNNKEVEAFNPNCLHLNCTNSDSYETNLFETEPTLPASIPVAAHSAEHEQQPTAPAEANNADLHSGAPPAKRAKFQPNIVSQKRHAIRALPLIKHKVNIDPQPAVIKSNNCLTASEALATDNTLFNSTQLQNLLEQPQSTNAAETLTESATTTKGSSLPAPFVTIRKVNTVNVAVQLENLPQERLQPETCVAVYRKLQQFHYFKKLSTEQIERHNLSTNAIEQSYQQALIYHEGKCYVHGALLPALFPHCSARLHRDVQLVLNDLDEFHFNTHVNFSREPDVRKHALYHFMRSAPVFCNFLLEYERGTRNFGRCIPINKQSGPYPNLNQPCLGPLQYAIKPVILVRMATFKLRLKNSNS